MKNSENTKKLLLEHCKKYPKLTAQDVFKLIFQSVFGCGHMVPSLDSAIEGICKEKGERHAHNGWENIQNFGREAPSPTNVTPCGVVEMLGGGYSRISLDALDFGLSAKTLGTLFFLSAREKTGTPNDIKKMLACAHELASEGSLPFDGSELEKAIREWELAGFAPMHHSNEFNYEYRPAYRVISNKYVPFIPLLAEIDAQIARRDLTLAIDGGCGSGKTTLAALLKEIYDCRVFHIDDFFLRPEQRTRERFLEIGGNFDRERFISEVMLPNSEGKDVLYRRFDCTLQKVLKAVRLTHKSLTVVEGVYSMHPELTKYYDLRVFLDISPSVQRERILKRNTPTLAKRFFEEWIPLENLYFEKMQIKEACDFCIFVTE